VRGDGTGSDGVTSVVLRSARGGTWKLKLKASLGSGGGGGSLPSTVEVLLRLGDACYRESPPLRCAATGAVLACRP